MKFMSVKLTVGIPKELREHMKKHSNINWSDVVRKAIEEKLKELEVEQAIKIMDEIASKTRPGKPLAEVIRRFRDERKWRPQFLMLVPSLNGFVKEEEFNEMRMIRDLLIRGRIEVYVPMLPFYRGF
jgi:Arc/MetJ-type ribon-helix-helix transcriptional regulator